MKLMRTPLGYALRLMIASVLLLSLQLACTESALAHANVVRSDPASNTVAEVSPAAVTIWFTEPLEPDFSEIQVLDGDGNRVNADDAIVGSQDPTVLSVALPSLTDGTYVVAWTNVSTVDGHKVRGSFLFSVGEPINATALADLPSPPLVPSPYEPVLRWLTLLGAMTIVGSLAFVVLILRPVLQRKDGLGKLAERTNGRLLKTIWVALGLLFAASWGHLLLQTVSTYEVPVAHALGRPLVSVLFDTGWGRLWLWRMGLILLLPAVLDLALRSPTAPENNAGNGVLTHHASQMLVLAAGLGILLTLSLGSHAAATPEIRAAAIFNDYLHLLAASFWGGGLISFAVVIPASIQIPVPPQRRSVLAGLASRFSILALVSMVTLVVTGLYSSWAQVTVLAAMRTAYGLTLAAKLSLLALILILAALNLLWIRPRLAQEDWAGRRLGQLVLGEIILAVLLLASVGLLTTLEPARQVASRTGIGQETGVSFLETLEGAEIKLEIEPAQAGANRVLITLADRRGNAIDNASDVSVRATYLEADLGESAVSARKLSQGQYEIEALPLTISGPWQMELVVRRPDAFDARTAFRFAVGAGAQSSSAAIAPSAFIGRWLWSLELALLGLLLLGVGLLVAGGWRTRRGLAISFGGSVTIVAAILLIISAQPIEPVQAEPIAVRGLPEGEEFSESNQQAIDAVPEPSTNPLRNPFAPNPASLTRGQTVFEANCTPCHGLTGRGDGPQAKGLEPPPADLLTHIPLHADIELFRIVRDGKTFTAMPGFSEVLTRDEIWHLVNYLRAFHADQNLAEETYRRGLEFVEQGDDAQALAAFDEAIELSPKHALAYFERGRAYRRQGEFELAVADHTKTIALKPDWADAYYQRGVDYNELREPSQAIPDYDQAIALDDEFPGAYYARGLAYADSGNMARAIQDFDAALERSPEYLQVYLDRSLAHYATGNWAGAQDDLQQYLQLAPESEERAAVAELARRLEAQLASDADLSSLTSHSILDVQALPAGFEAIPLAELGLTEGKRIGNGIVIDQGFAFGHSDLFELIWGFTMPLAAGDLQPVPEMDVGVEELLTLLQEGTGGIGILEQQELSLPAGLGNDGVALRIVTATETRKTRVDAAYFETDTVGTVIVFMYPDGRDPAVELGDLAGKLYDRITQQQSTK